MTPPLACARFHRNARHRVGRPPDSCFADSKVIGATLLSGANWNAVARSSRCVLFRGKSWPGRREAAGPCLAAIATSPAVGLGLEAVMRDGISDRQPGPRRQVRAAADGYVRLARAAVHQDHSAGLLGERPSISISVCGPTAKLWTAICRARRVCTVARHFGKARQSCGTHAVADVDNRRGKPGGQRGQCRPQIRRRCRSHRAERVPREPDSALRHRPIAARQNRPSSARL